MQKQTRFKNRLTSLAQRVLKRICVLGMLLLCSIPLIAQEVADDGFGFQFDHYSFIVKNLAKTGAFYKEVLHLEEIQHPSDTINFKWFRVSGNGQLHLIRKDNVPMEHSKSVHLCLATQQLDTLIAHLKSKNITFSDWEGNVNGVTLRPDGVRQIYVQDPENNWVEINDAAH